MSTPRLEFNECGSPQRVFTDHSSDEKLLRNLFLAYMIIILKPRECAHYYKHAGYAAI
jgi:hypothetical protein